MNLTAVLLFAAGFVLIYGAVKNVNPKDVVVSAFKGENPSDLPKWGGSTGGDTGQQEPPSQFGTPGMPGRPPDPGGVPGFPGAPNSPIVPPGNAVSL